MTVEFAFENGAAGWMYNIGTTPFYCRITAFGNRGRAQARRNEKIDVPIAATLEVCGLRN